MGLVAGLVGTFTVLRQRALAGDVFAHATLPGLCLAFIAVQERRLWLLLAGAALTGSLAMLAVSILTKNSRIKDDSALALVLGVFLALESYCHAGFRTRLPKAQRQDLILSCSVKHLE